MICCIKYHVANNMQRLKRGVNKYLRGYYTRTGKDNYSKLHFQVNYTALC